MKKKQFDFRKMSFYQIWIRSFCDGNGDGIGDLYGVYDKLDYIKSLGVDGIWFSPIFLFFNADYGYDISDYKNIHPEYGTLEQFQKVLDRAHELGLKVLLDLVINHTSDEHPWFIESCKGRDNPYSNYYIWRDPLGVKIEKTLEEASEILTEKRDELEEISGFPVDQRKREKRKEKGKGKRKENRRQTKNKAEQFRPPNNWFSQFEGLAWEYNEQRGQYYLHIFARKQPDLNMDNPGVREEVKSIMRFWLDLGVDGFREDVINFISKDPRLPDGLPFLPVINGLPFYKDGPNLHKYLQEFREVALEYGAVQIGEAPFTGVKKALTYIAGKDRVLDMLIQFDTMMADCFMTEYVYHGFRLRKLKRAFSKWEYGLQGKQYVLIPLSELERGVQYTVTYYRYPKLLPDDPYPGTEKRGTKWTKKELGDVMDYMNDFVERWGAQIYVGEFSCMSIQPGAAQWLDDVADLIEKHGYKFWTFHSYGEFYGWNLETIRDAGTGKLRDIRDGETTDRLEAMKRHWAKNRE